MIIIKDNLIYSVGCGKFGFVVPSRTNIYSSGDSVLYD